MFEAVVQFMGGVFLLHNNVFAASRKSDRKAKYTHGLRLELRMGKKNCANQIITLKSTEQSSVKGLLNRKYATYMTGTLNKIRMTRSGR